MGDASRHARDTMRRDRSRLPDAEVTSRHAARHPQGPILYLEDVSVSFDGFKALNALNLYIDAGELRCIIGPNGAGKTTMMDVITGKTRPGHRQRLLRPDHRPAEAERARDRAGRHRPQVPEAHGVRAAQRVRQPGTGHEGGQARVEDLFARLAASSATASTRCWTVGLSDAARRHAGALSHGQKQWLEIGMLLMQNPRCCWSTNRSPA
jgi:urea transport system ATP-binding protein